MHFRRHFPLMLSLCLILALSACSMGGGSVTTGKALQTQTVNLGGSGGDFEIGNLAVNINPNVGQSDATLTLTEYQLPLEEGVDGQTSLFAVEGLPLDFSGMLQATLTIPDKTLNSLDRNDPDAAQQLTFLFGTYAFSPSAGDYVYDMHPVDASIDLDAGVAVLQVLVPEGMGMAAKKVAAPIIKPSGQSSEPHLSKNDFFFIIKNDGGRNIAESDHFRVYYAKNSNALTPATISRVMDALEDVRSDILSMDFPWGQTEDNLKFPVFIQNCDKLEYIFWGKSTTTCTGEFQYSVLSGFQLILPTETVLADTQTQKAVIGHELMHYAQSISHINDLAYTIETMARTGGSPDWLLLDEAAATWYEKRITGDPDWLPNVAAMNAEFYLQPWYFDASNVDLGNFGYGASWFVRYLADQGGDALVNNAYYGTGTQTGNEALAASIFQQTGAAIQNQFTHFLAEYLINPATFSAGLPATQYFSNIYTPKVLLSASGNQLDYQEIMISSKQTGLTITTVPGNINSEGMVDLPATASIGRALPGSMTANFFRFEFPQENLSWRQDAWITVQAVTESGGGVMVYGLSSGGIGGGVPLAGPDNYLSSQGGKATLVIPDDGSYQQLAFILFNDTSPSTPTSAYVEVKISYGPPQSATLTGNAIVTNETYPQNYCDVLNGCYPYTNPPACVQTGGGGGGGGEDTEVVIVVPQPCPVVAEWCYYCSEHYHAAQMLSYTFYDGIEYYIEIDLDAEGKITNIDFPWGDEQVTGPDIQMIDETNFNASWTFRDILSQKPYTTWAMSGVVDASGGFGVWNLSYEGVGELFSGTWTVQP